MLHPPFVLTRLRSWHINEAEQPGGSEVSPVRDGPCLGGRGQAPRIPGPRRPAPVVGTGDGWQHWMPGPSQAPPGKEGGGGPVSPLGDMAPGCSLLLPE